MSKKDDLLNNLHKDYREDPYLESLMESSGKELETIGTKSSNLNNEFFFDTMTAFGVAMYEKEMDFDTTGSLEDQRNQIEARWKTAGKCDLELLQIIANSWRNGEITVLFTNAKIEIVFISLIGIPYDIENLKYAIETAKPAHIPISYTFRYRTWGMVNSLGNTWGYYNTQGYTWEEMREKEGDL
jgi:hypothetical protein